MLFMRVLRSTAWLLAIATFLELFSGFLVLNPSLKIIGLADAIFIHNIVAPLIFIPLFYLHSLSGLLFLVSRKGHGSRLFKAAVTVLWTALFLSFGLLYAGTLFR